MSRAQAPTLEHSPKETSYTVWKRILFLPEIIARMKLKVRGYLFLTWIGGEKKGYRAKGPLGILSLESSHFPKYREPFPTELRRYLNLLPFKTIV
jgi:hypothetical protein